MSLRSNLLSLLQVNTPAMGQRGNSGGGGGDDDAVADTFVSSGWV
jgi:hypothetical protein